MMKILLSLLALSASTLTYAGCGGDGPPLPPRHGQRNGPPPIDTAACKGKSSGETVEITLPDGKTLKGSCQLAFIPERPAGAPPAGEKPQ